MRTIWASIAAFLLWAVMASAATSYNQTSYYVAYDEDDPTQFALIMPGVSMLFTHVAGQIDADDVHNITSSFDGMPTYDNGSVTFGALGGSSSWGADSLANRTMEVGYFYIQKSGTTYYLYDRARNELSEGTAGDSSSFQTVDSGTTYSFDLETGVLMVEESATTDSTGESVSYDPITGAVTNRGSDAVNIINMIIDYSGQMSSGSSMVSVSGSSNFLTGDATVVIDGESYSYNLYEYSSLSYDDLFPIEIPAGETTEIQDDMSYTGDVDGADGTIEYDIQIILDNGETISVTYTYSY